MADKPLKGRRDGTGDYLIIDGGTDEGSDAPLAPEIAEKVAPGATPAKQWKVGDRVCFAHEPLGQVYRVTRVHEDEPCVEVQNSAGLYASHLFVPAPAEPISLPPIELEPIKPKEADPGVAAKLSYWLGHARNAGAPHVCVPCEAAEEILKLLGDR